jgi:hypothetical protein
VLNLWKQRFPWISRSLKVKALHSLETLEYFYPMTRLHIPEERSPAPNHCGNKTRTVVKVCCDLYESLRENVLQKSGLSYGNEHNHGRTGSFFLVVYM